MTDISLISIDGIPGSGKSTTALWLSDMLRKRGAAVRLVAENEKPHPVRFLTDLKNPLAPWLEILPAEFSRASLEKFSRFLEMSAVPPGTETIVIVDGLLFHTDSTSLLLMDPEEGVFERHIEGLLKIAGQVRFFPILLYDHPHGSGIATTMANRSLEWKTMQIDWKTSSPYCTARKLSDATGYIRFYEQYEKRIYDAFRSLIHQKDKGLLLENPAGDWIGSRDRLWSFCAGNVGPSPFLNDLL